MGTGATATGIEPGTSLPEGQNRAREEGRLETLDPGEAREFVLRFRVLEGAAVSSAREAVARLAMAGRSGVPALVDYPR